MRRAFCTVSSIGFWFGLELVAEKPKVKNKRKTQNWEKVKRVKKAFSLKRNLSVKRIIAEKPQKLNFGVIARSGFSARFRASFCGERFARLARLASSHGSRLEK